MISDICKKYGISKYTINEDGSIDVDDNVDLYSMGLTELPLNFNKVNGYFNCSFNKLTTLKGCPKIITDDFNCNRNKINNLEYGPEIIGGDYYILKNNLYRIDHYPKYIGRLAYFDDYVALPHELISSHRPVDEEYYLVISYYNKLYNTYFLNTHRKTTINNILYSGK